MMNRNSKLLTCVWDTLRLLGSLSAYKKKYTLTDWLVKVSTEKKETMRV